jgi:hypothetical protein
MRSVIAKEPKATVAISALSINNPGSKMSLTEECAKVTGIPYLMDCGREETMQILDS